MARLHDDAANDEAVNLAAVVTAPPYTIGGFCRTNDVGVTGAVIGFSDTGAANMYMGISVGAGASDEVRFFARAGGSEINAIASSGVTVNTDHHICGVAVATNSRFIYVDGGSKVESTSSVVPTGINHTSIGFIERNGAPVYYFSGSLWELFVYNVALNDREVAALANRVSPALIRPQNLVAYWKYFGNASPEPDELGGFPMSLTGTVKSAHGGMIYPDNSELFIPPSAVVAAPPVQRLIGSPSQSPSMSPSHSPELVPVKFGNPYF